MKRCCYPSSNTPCTDRAERFIIGIVNHDQCIRLVYGYCKSHFSRISMVRDFGITYKEISEEEAEVYQVMDS